MRHSRKAVMIERYKLYLKKHTFNGKYFVRNVQIGVGLVLVLALIVGISMVCLSQKDETIAENADISLKAALFGLDVTEEKTTKKEKKNTETTTEVVTEAVKEVAQATTEEATTAVETESTEEIQVEATTEEPSLFDDRCIANVEESLNVRKEPDSDSDFVGQMNNGAIAKILGTEGEWTKIKSGDVTGYVLSEFVLTGEAAEKISEQFVTRTGTVLEDGVNIRADRSTDAEILHVFDKGDTVSVVEVPEEETTEEIQEQVTTEVSSEEVAEVSTEATTEMTTGSLTENIESYATAAGVKVEADDQEAATVEEKINWVTVYLEDGQIGYVSDKFIQIDELYELAVSAEELQRIAEEKARAEAEEAARMAMASDDSSSNSTYADNSNSDNSNSSNSSNNDYTGETTTPERADTSGDCLGTFTITAYCGCSQCSGGSNRTASGTVPTEGRTIAADTSILPYGTQVVIDGIVYTVEDCGSGVSGNHIDIFFATHERALAFGRRSMKVYLY